MAPRRRYPDIETLAAALASETYPLDKTGLYYSVGDLRAHNARGDALWVRDVIDVLPARSFASAHDALENVLGVLGLTLSASRLLAQIQMPSSATFAAEHQAPRLGEDQLIDQVERDAEGRDLATGIGRDRDEARQHHTEMAERRQRSERYEGAGKEPGHPELNREEL